MRYKDFGTAGLGPSSRVRDCRTGKGTRPLRGLVFLEGSFYKHVTPVKLVGNDGDLARGHSNRSWDRGIVGPWDRGTVGPWDRGTVGS